MKTFFVAGLSGVVTRDGRKVTIAAVESHPVYPVVGYIAGDPVKHCWTVNGHFWNDSPGHGYDLMITEQEPRATEPSQDSVALFDKTGKTFEIFMDGSVKFKSSGCVVHLPSEFVQRIAKQYAHMFPS